MVKASQRFPCTLFAGVISQYLFRQLSFARQQTIFCRDFVILLPEPLSKLAFSFSLSHCGYFFGREFRIQSQFLTNLPWRLSVLASMTPPAAVGKNPRGQTGTAGTNWAIHSVPDNPVAEFAEKFDHFSVSLS
jgi:hypothetical protein